MGKPDLIEQRQYAETVMAGLNIRPFRVDVNEGLLLVPKARVGVAQSSASISTGLLWWHR